MVDDLLVGSDCWRMASLVVEPDGSVLMSVVPSTVSANCPVCGTTSTRRHTWYRRTALDLPWRSSQCDYAFGHGGFSVMNAVAGGRPLRSASRDCCRVTLAEPMKRPASCWHSPSVLAVKPEPDSRALPVCQPVPIPCAVCCGTRTSA
jgi:hypothetical protein